MLPSQRLQSILGHSHTYLTTVTLLLKSLIDLTPSPHPPPPVCINATLLSPRHNSGLSSVSLPPHEPPCLKSMVRARGGDLLKCKSDHPTPHWKLLPMSPAPRWSLGLSPSSWLPFPSLGPDATRPPLPSSSPTQTGPLLPQGSETHPADWVL